LRIFHGSLERRAGVSAAGSAEERQSEKEDGGPDFHGFDCLARASARGVEMKARRKKREETTWESRGGAARSAFARSIALDSPEAGLLTRRSSRAGAFPFHRRNSGLHCLQLLEIALQLLRSGRPVRCSQWRDRAGFSPASLFTRPNRRAPQGVLKLACGSPLGQFRNPNRRNTPVMRRSTTIARAASANL